MDNPPCLLHAAIRAGQRLGALKAIGAALAIAALAAAGTASAADSAPAIHRIVAVGDLHGDFAAWRAIARAAGLIDRNGHWTGGAAVLIQDGDVVDRGSQSVAIVHDLMRLQREASRAHGRVIAIVGNHEAMNLTGDLRYVSAADFASYADANSPARRDAVFAANEAAIRADYRRRDPALTPDQVRRAWNAATPLGWVEHELAWRPDGPIGSWVIGNPAVVMLDGTLFVHGGISVAYSCLPIAGINQRVAAALRARDTGPDSIINDPSGPLWYRGLVSRDPAVESGPPTSGPCGRSPNAVSMSDELDQVLAAYGARRMVIAHTPILSGIAVLHDGALVRIDTGISAVFGGKLSYLEITDGVLTPHEIPRP